VTAVSLNEIANYQALSETLASSGQPAASQFEAIAAAGFEVVINLAMPDSDNAIPEEGRIVTAHEMTYVHLPVPFDAPTAGHLRSFFALLQAFEGKRCWVHCVVNQRASAFLYQYFRLVRGVSAEQAKKVVIAGWRPDPVWRDFMALEAQDLGL
jgi:protein tyrosine phosphatase (PTP) superfamily phosphohydrolase (DUF442 family)